MGNKPIVEKSEFEQIPEDGRLSLGSEYAHRKVPLEINVPMDEMDDEPDNGEYMFYTVDKFEADSRGRVTLPAPIQENFTEVLWIVSEAAYKHGSLGEAYDARNNE